MTAQELSRRIHALQGERDGLLRLQGEAATRLRNASRAQKRTEQAQVIVREVAQQTQQQLQYHIAGMVTMALAAVFEDNPYTFCVEFVQRRGRTECDLYFERDGDRVHPMTASGGGAVDVASFALRVALLTLRRPRPRMVLVLDEPFRHLSDNYGKKASLLLHELSAKIGLQIIMVTHSEELVENADKVFVVSKRRVSSLVRDMPNLREEG